MLSATALAALLSATVVTMAAAASSPSPTILTYGDVRGSPYAVATDDRGILVNGSRSLFLSGSVHYPRSTPLMWDGLLAEARANGLTMITVYVFWNLHEPVRGTYDFETGRRNLPLFLQKAADHGLFVYLRPGPYVCAEWDYGGLPVWLHGIDGMSFRSTAAPWKTEMARWMKKVVSVVRPFLASNGGPVMLGQIENELWPGGYFPGGDQAAYTDWCADLAYSLGAHIPWTMCNGASANSTANTFNGNDAVTQWFFREDGYGHQWPNGSHAKQPMIWTEDEMWFQSWPAADTGTAAASSGDAAPAGRPSTDRSRTGVLEEAELTEAERRGGWGTRSSSGQIDASATSFAIARFFARGAVLHNFYMWFGGNNYERTAGANVMTAYADASPLHADGLRNEPSFSHLTKLHAVLAALSRVITSVPPQIGASTNCTELQQQGRGEGAAEGAAEGGGEGAGTSTVVAFRYRHGGDDIIFVENSDDVHPANSTSKQARCWGHAYELGPNSILIANTTSGKVFWASSAFAPASTKRIYTPVHNAPLVWEAFSEPLLLGTGAGAAAGEPAVAAAAATAADAGVIRADHPLEQLNLTQDRTGYCVYQRAFQIDADTDSDAAAVTLPLVIMGRSNNGYIIAVDGRMVGQVEHHRSQSLSAVNLTTNITFARASRQARQAGQAGAGSQHTLTVVSVSLGLRNDDIFADAREAKGFTQLLLGGRNLTAAAVYNDAKSGDSVAAASAAGSAAAGGWLHRVGLAGEQKAIRTLPSAAATANASMVWLQANFTLLYDPRAPPQRADPFSAHTAPQLSHVVDATGLGRGHLYVNSFDIGMYWPLVPNPDARAGQRYYHIPPEALRKGLNTLVALEEVGAPRPDLVRLATVSLAGGTRAGDIVLAEER